MVGDITRVGKKNRGTCDHYTCCFTYSPFEAINSVEKKSNNNRVFSGSSTAKFLGVIFVSPESCSVQTMAMGVFGSLPTEARLVVGKKTL